MKKNNFSIGNLKKDLCNANVILFKDFMTFSGAKSGFNIGFIVNNLLEDKFNLGPKLKLNIEKRLYDEGNTITLIDNDGLSHTYTFTNDNCYLCQELEGVVLFKEIDKYVIEYPDGSKEEYDLDGKLLKVFDKYNRQIFTYTYVSNLLTSFVNATGDGIDVIYTNGKITSIRNHRTNHSMVEISYATNVVNIMIGNVLFKVDYNSDLVVKTLKNNTIEKERFLYESSDGIRFKTFVDNTLVSHLKYSKTVKTNEVKVIEEDVVKDIRFAYHFDNKKKLIKYYELFEEMFADIGSSEVFEIYKGLVTFTDNEKYCAKISGYPVIDRAFEDILPAVLVPNEENHFIFSAWVKKNTASPILHLTGDIGQDIARIETELNDNEWELVEKLINITSTDSTENILLTKENLTDNEYVVKDVRLTPLSTNFVVNKDFVRVNNRNHSLENVFLRVGYNGSTKEIHDLKYSDILSLQQRYDKLPNGYFVLNDEVHFCEYVLVVVDGVGYDLGSVYLYRKTVSDNSTFVTKTHIFSGLVLETYFEEDDINQKVTKVIDCHGDVSRVEKEDIVEEYTYDSNHLLISKEITKSPFNIKVEETYEYDISGEHLTKKTLPDGSVLEYTYDSLGRVIQEKNGTVIANYTYSDGNLVTTTVGTHTINYTYSDGLLVKALEGSSEYNFTYELNKLKGIHEGSILVSEFIYENNDQEITKRVYTSTTEYYDMKEYYDKYGRKIKESIISGGTETVKKEYQYNIKDFTNTDIVASTGSSVLSKEISGSSYEKYVYNTKGQIASVITPSLTTTYEYDEKDRLIEVVNPNRGNTKEVYEYETTDRACQRIKKITHFTKSGETYNQYYSIEYTFDEFKRVSSEIRNMGNFTLTKVYEYLGDETNTTNLISSVTTYKNGNETKEETYEYDSRGNITQINLNGTRYRKYTYDDLNRLIQEEQSYYTYVYEYDSNGNITCKKTYKTSTGVTGTPEDTINYLYDTNRPNRLTRYDGVAQSTSYEGNITSIEDYSASYTNKKLTGLYKSNRTTGTHTYTYYYNNEGERFKKTYSYIPRNLDAAVFVRDETTTYSLSNGKILSENILQNNSDNTSGTITHTFRYIGEELVGIRKDGVEYYYEKNTFGDIIKIYDGDGNVVGSYSYDAWGETSVSGSSSTSVAYWNPFRYRGYYYDDETQLFYSNSRYYNPEWGRWIQPANESSLNPSSINGLNLYSYANNNPIGITYSSFGDAVATSGSMVSAVRKTNLSLNSNISKSSFSFDPNLLGDWFAHNESLYSHGAAILDVIRQSKGLEQLEVLSKISKVLMHFGYWLNVGLSAHNNFTNEELSRREQWVSFTVDTIHNTGQTVGSYFLGGIPYAGPFLAIGVPITVDYLWSGELCVFGFDLDFVPAITIKGKTPEEWVKYWINSWFE